MTTKVSMFSIVLFVVALISQEANSFSTSPTRVGTQRHFRTALHAVVDIGSEAAFDKTIKGAGSALVIVDYSTTWCGPCKGTLHPFAMRD